MADFRVSSGSVAKDSGAGLRRPFPLKASTQQNVLGGAILVRAHVATISLPSLAGMVWCVSSGVFWVLLAACLPTPRRLELCVVPYPIEQRVMQLAVART